MRNPRRIQKFPFPRTGNKWESLRELGENPLQGETAVFVVCVCVCVCVSACVSVCLRVRACVCVRVWSVSVWSAGV